MTQPSTAVEIDFTPSKAPLPVDATGLAYWLGLKQKVLWWLILFRHKHYKEFKIPKPNGTYRILHEPREELKFAQKMVMGRILSKFPCPAHIGAYETNRGVKYTTERHAGHQTLLELDIKDFFGSTTRRYVREFFYNQNWPKESARLLADLLTYPVQKNYSIVPQGAPSSPMLCNLIANDRFDQEIISYLHTVDAKWLYTRYSDNLIISHPEMRSREEVNDVLKTVKQLIKSGGYLVHPEKVRIMRSTHPKKPQHLLGLTTNVIPNIPVQKYKRLRAQVHKALTEGFDKVSGLPGDVKTPEQVISHLGGLINYYLYINASPKLQKLKLKFDAAVIEHNNRKSASTSIPT